MEPFSITCTTCKSRLKVRSAAAIGQVVSCPKCGGMVLVKAPEEVPPEVANAATKPVDQQEKANPNNTKDFDDVASILAGAAPVPVDAASRGEQPRAADKPAAPATPATDASGDVPSPAKTPPGGATTAPEGRYSPVPGARHYGLWLALSVLMGIALATAVVIAGSLLRDRGEKIVKANETAGTPQEAANPSPNPEATPAENPTAKKTQTNPPSTPMNDVSPQPAPAEPEAKSNTKSSDPLDLVEPPKATSKSPMPPLSIGDDPLGKFGNVLGAANDNPLPAVETPAAADTKGDEPPGDAAAPAVPRPAPRTIDVAARLADPLAGIDVPGVPLADFLAELSNLSSIPITLDPEGMSLAGLSAETPVSLKADNTTIGKTLTQALTPLHLEYQVVDDQLLVSLGSKLSDRAAAVDDLTGRDEEQAERLAEWTTGLVEPAIWKSGEEEGPALTPGVDQFAVRASDRTYASILLLMEKLRIARGLPLRTKQPAETFRLETRTSKASSKLAAPLSLNFGPSNLLVNILRRLERESQIRILVDWRALAADGWNADGEATLSLQNKPLGEALTTLLQPLDLTWRAIDEQTVQITSLAALAQTPELELYPVPELAADTAGGDALLARLRGTLTLPADTPWRLYFDPVSRCILASLPQPQQREVERQLNEWSEQPPERN